VTEFCTSLRVTAAATSLCATILSGCPQPQSSSVIPSCVVENEADLRELSGSGELDCLLWIRGTELSSLDEFRDITRVQRVILDDNPRLDDIESLLSVEVASMTAHHTNLAGTQLLPSTVTELGVTDIGSRSIGSAATEMHHIYLDESPLLERISFPQLNTIEQIRLRELPALTSLDFPSLQSATHVTIRGNALLSAEEIDRLSVQLSESEAESIDHCGNLDDEPC
jgi:hypothetical protein